MAGDDNARFCEPCQSNVHNGEYLPRKLDPFELVAHLGISLAVTIPVAAPRRWALAVAVGASVDDVRNALGATLDESWLRIEANCVGVLIMAAGGEIGTQAWDVAEA